MNGTDRWEAIKPEVTDMGKYDDIIGLPHHRSDRHPPMPEADRAAQFAPFAALTGYGDAIDESARMTEAQIEMTEEEKRELGEKLKIIFLRGEEAEIVRFVPDARKSGGSYETVHCRIRRITENDHTVITETGERIAMETIRTATSPYFDRTEY